MARRHRVGGARCGALFGGGIRRRRTPTGSGWSRTGADRAGSWMQSDPSQGLDGNESRHLAVSAARLAHGSGACGAGPAAEIRQVRHTDRIAHGRGPQQRRQRNGHIAPLQGSREHPVWSAARLVRHPRCRQPGGGGSPWRELLQKAEGGERRRCRAPRDPAGRWNISIPIGPRGLQPDPRGGTRPRRSTVPAQASPAGLGRGCELQPAGQRQRHHLRRADHRRGVEDASINFPDGNPNYALVHDQVIAIDPVHRTVTLNLINGFSFGKPVLYISTDSSDPTVSAIEGNTFAPRMHRLEVGIDDIARSAVERIFIAVNGPSEGACANPQRQGIFAALTDGHRPNNTFGGIPTTATDYSPVWV